MDNREELIKEIQDTIFNYQKDFPTLDGCDELAEIILHKICKKLPTTGKGFISSSQFCQFGCELKDGIFYAKNGHRCAGTGCAKIFNQPHI